MKKFIALTLVAALTLGVFAAPAHAVESVFHNTATIENNRHYQNSGYNHRPGQPGPGHRPQPGRPNNPGHHQPAPNHRPNHRPGRHDSNAKWVGLGIGALAVIGAAIAHSNR